MEDLSIQELLQKVYEDALAASSLGTVPELPDEVELAKKVVIALSESAKGVLTVLLTSSFYKLLNPEQDIRLHQVSIVGGYSGRGFDTAFITPWLSANRFPAMRESGWLTRSLEQKMPYDENYPGAIRPVELKKAFLFLINYVQFSSSGALYNLLVSMVADLIEIREKNDIALVVPRNLSIQQIVKVLSYHFNGEYKFEGAARLPVLALYASLRILVNEVQRYCNKILLPLESHSSADSQSHRMGDIDIVNTDNSSFEAVEVKLGRPITVDMVNIAYSKFSCGSTMRYYLLSTSGILEKEQLAIVQKIDNIKRIHGCQVIVNGVLETLTYYLRLISDTTLFLAEYTRLLTEDAAIKYEHREAWNGIVASF